MGVLKVWDGTAWQFISAASDGDGASVYVGPEAPPGIPDTGDMWFDSDEDGTTGTTLPLTVADGGTGATSAAVARTNLGISTAGNSTSTPGAPTTGTWARGDQWLDSVRMLWVCTAGGTPGTWAPPYGTLVYVNHVALPDFAGSAGGSQLPVTAVGGMPTFSFPTYSVATVHMLAGFSGAGYVDWQTDVYAYSKDASVVTTPNVRAQTALWATNPTSAIWSNPAGASVGYFVRINVALGGGAGNFHTGGVAGLCVYSA